MVLNLRVADKHIARSEVSIVKAVCFESRRSDGKSLIREAIQKTSLSRGRIAVKYPLYFPAKMPSIQRRNFALPVKKIKNPGELKLKSRSPSEKKIVLAIPDLANHSG